MAPRSLRTSFGIFHVTLAAVVLTQSILTVMHGLRVGPAGHHQVLVGGIEAIGAALFLLAPTLRVGGALMLLAFAIAIVAHGLPNGLTLLVYAAGTVFVMVHGSVWSHGRPRRIAAR